MRFRPTLPFFSALLATVPTAAHAQEFVAEAPVLVAFVASRTGESQSIELPDGGTEERATRSLVRIGARELLEQLAALDVIPNPMGWRIIAVWADWEGTGSGYRFFVQNVRDRSDVRAIPDETLHFEVLQSATARKHTLSGETIVGGSETYTSYAQLKVALSSGAGTVNGLATSSDIYRRLRGVEAAVYVPGTTLFRGSGIWDDSQPATPDSVLEGRFGVGVMRLVSASVYENKLPKAVTGTLTLATATQLAGLGNATLHVASGTLTLPAAGSTMSFSQLTLVPGTTLEWTSPPSLLFETVTIPAGVTLRQNGLSVVTGAPLSFVDGAFNTFDLTAPPSGYVITDGVLSTAP